MESIKLRAWKITDIGRLVELADNINISKNMVDAFPSPYTKEAGLKFIEMAMSETPVRILAVEVNGDIAGSVGIHPQQDIMRLNAELGYWFGEPYWGKGIATNAVRQVIDYAFKNFEINRLFARPFGTNKASQRVLEKAGFILEARIKQSIIKNGQLLDELIYAVRRQE